MTNVAMHYSVCVYFVVFMSSPFFVATGYESDCLLHVHNSDTERVSPLLLYNFSSNFDFVLPVKGTVKLKNGEGITFACTENKNFITATNSDSTYATCAGNDLLQITNKNLRFEDMICKKAIKGDIRNTHESCANNRGRFLNIGYAVTRTNWITLIRVCYDENVGNTLYTEHTLYGREIKYASKSTYRPGFSTAGLGPDIAASVAYKQAFQKSTFNKLLGSARVADLYINEKSFLARGHLSPHADFIYASFQSSTYYYINSCPQWQVINGGNWKSLETTVRKTAEKYNNTFTIITGTYDILSLNDANNNPRDIYLVSGDKLPVPKYIWKIVYSDDIKKGIALIVLNNPFVESISEEDHLCKNICDKYGWGSDNWSDPNRGYVHCCDLNQFVNVVNTSPFLEVHGVLYGIPFL